MGVLGYLGRHIVTNDRVKACNQHQAVVMSVCESTIRRARRNIPLFHDLSYFFFIRFHTIDKVRLEAPHSICKESGAVQQISDQDRLEDVELKVALGSGEGDSNVIAKDLSADHGEGLTLSRVNLARHDG